MNVERLNMVADAIEDGLPNMTFNMQYYWRQADCGTVACIAGHAAELMIERGEYMPGATVFTVARLWLDLDLLDANDLFKPSTVVGPYRHLKEIDKGVAVRCIRNFARGGDINWAQAHDEFFWGADG